MKITMSISRAAFAILFCLGMASSVFAGGLKEAEAEVIAIVDKVKPCVVRIFVTPLIRDAARLEFQISGERQPCTCSGVIVSADGYITTVASGIYGAQIVKVVGHDGRKWDAKVVGSDMDTNVALLKIEAENLPWIRLAENESKPGSWILAVGNPFGMKHSVATGIVSGQDRAQVGANFILLNLIQTSTPVNPGDAGGLLVNSDGDMIGLLTSNSTFNAVALNILKGFFHTAFRPGDELSRDLLALVKKAEQLSKNSTEKNEEILGGMIDMYVAKVRQNFAKELEDSLRRYHDNLLKAQALNFAIPVSTIGPVVEALKKGAVTPRAWMGIRIQELTNEELAVNDLNNGVCITQVFKNSPAAQAKLQAGDIIFQYNQKPVEDFLSLRGLMFQSVASDSVRLRLLRNGEEMELDIILGEKYYQKKK